MTDDATSPDRGSTDDASSTGEPDDASSTGEPDDASPTGEPDDDQPFYEAVVPQPTGETTVEQFVATARRYDYDGVVVLTRPGESAPSVPDSGIDVVHAVEIDASDPASASGAIGNHRPECDVLAVRGGSPELNRFAVEQPKVDVLTMPFVEAGDVNHVIVKTAKEHGVRLAVRLSPVLRDAGGSRVQFLSKLRKLRELLADYDAPFVVTARPTSHLELRAPRELAAVGNRIGFSSEAIRAGLREWGAIVRHNRRRRSESFISPGVRLSDCEEDDR